MVRKNTDASKKTSGKRKPWTKMTADELSEATKEFDHGVDLDETRPLSPENQAWWDRAKRGGRPKVGKGSRPVLITVEKGLLEQADAFARAKGLNRSQLFAKSVRLLMQRR
jgi:hypothetical protein